MFKIKYKYIGFIIGFVVGNFIGGIIGYVIGAVLDGINESKVTSGSQQPGYGNGRGNEIDTFLYYLMYLSADIIFADGKIYQTETVFLRKYLSEALGTEAAQKGMTFFEQLKMERRQRGVAAWNASVQKVCRDLNKLMPEAHRLQIIAFHAEISKCDGIPDATEIKALRNIAYHMGLDADVVNQMFALGGQTLEDAYTVLGVSPDASDDDVRKAYKKMVLQHHPRPSVALRRRGEKNAATKKNARNQQGKRRHLHRSWHEII
ncbi:MAG: DnaJ domain-containing protein [Porphyromonadaceae bacterium]|nr:MAG: DnaJ domain-containing protein [Porphyromonadaceae bacterium]